MTTWTGSSRSAAIAWLGLGVGVLLIALEVGLWSTSPMWVKLLNGVLAIAIPVVLMIASRLVVEVTTEAFVVRWGPTRWPARMIPWPQVTAVSVVDVDPWHWGGWGYRWIPGEKSTAAVVRGGPGIKLDLRDGRHFIVTVDDADVGARAAAAVLAR